MSDRFFNHWLTKLFGEYEVTEKPGAKPYKLSRAHMHSQNLNDRGYRDDEGVYHKQPQGPMWQNGRAWFTFGRGPRGESYYDRNGDKAIQVNLNWHFGDRHSGLAAWIDGCNSWSDDGPMLQFHVAIPFVSLFLSITKRGWRPGRCGFSWAGSSDFLQIFWNHRDPHMDSSRQTGFSKSWFMNDVVFGRAKYENKVIDTRPVVIHMPEGSYRGVCKLEESTWKRPRWPGLWHHRRGATLEVEGGIPVPGKGENSWDCDDDAIYSQSSPSETVEAAIASYRASVMKTRGRYGGQNWVPRDGWKASSST